MRGQASKQAFNINGDIEVNRPNTNCYGSSGAGSKTCPSPRARQKRRQTNRLTDQTKTRLSLVALRRAVFTALARQKAATKPPSSGPFARHCALPSEFGSPPT